MNVRESYSPALEQGTLRRGGGLQRGTADNKVDDGRSNRAEAEAGLLYEVNWSCGDFWLRRERKKRKEEESIEPRLPGWTRPGKKSGGPNGRWNFLAVNLAFDCQKEEMALCGEKSSVSSATGPHLIFSLDTATAAGGGETERGVGGWTTGRRKRRGPAAAAAKLFSSMHSLQSSGRTQKSWNLSHPKLPSAQFTTRLECCDHNNFCYTRIRF